MRGRPVAARAILIAASTAEQRHAQLGEVARLRVEQLAHPGDHLRVVAPDGEHAVAAEQVQVAIAVGVDQMRPLATDPRPVEPERLEDPPHLGVQVALVQLHLLARALGDDLRYRRRCRAGHHRTGYSEPSAGSVPVSPRARVRARGPVLSGVPCGACGRRTYTRLGR
jgi:hypothetical protein